MPPLSPAIAVAYCQQEHLVLVGHNLELLIGPTETVVIAVLARDAKGHFLAISPVDIYGVPGVGNIDLNDASARFAKLRQSNESALAN